MISSVGKDKIFSLKFSYFARKMIESKLTCALAVEWKSLQSIRSIPCSLFMKYNLGSKSLNWHLHKLKANYLLQYISSTWLTNHSSDWMGLFPLIGWDILQSWDIFDYQRRRHLGYVVIKVKIPASCYPTKVACDTCGIQKVVTFFPYLVFRHIIKSGLTGMSAFKTHISCISAPSAQSGFIWYLQHFRDPSQILPCVTNTQNTSWKKRTWLYQNNMKYVPVWK